MFDRLGKKREVRFGRVNVSRAAALRGVTWPVPPLMLSSLSFASQREGGSPPRLPQFFPFFLLQLLARILPKKLHPVVLLPDIISCRPRPRHRLSGHKKCLKVGAEVSSGTVFSAEAWLAIEWSELGMAVAIERTPVILCALLAFTDLVAASSGASLTFAPEAAGFK